MIRKSILVMVALVSVVAATAAFVLTRHEAEWTTDSPQALKEFRRGLDADGKYYKADAIEHYKSALKLDPGFVAAKLRLVLAGGEKDHEKILADLRKTDATKLTERERFLLKLTIARLSNDRATSKKIVDAYVSAHPDDAFGLYERCNQVWSTRDLPNSKKCYEKLLKVAPNWVLAQNTLGYIEMAEGNFAEAENAFRTYRYIAPDQANPHDSLGELLTVIGRYDEAEKELREALRVRPDFCSSWAHLFDLALFRGDYEKARRLATEVAQEKACPSEMRSWSTSPRIAVWQMADAGRAEEIVAIPPDKINSKEQDVLVIRHAAALQLGDRTEAERLEREVAKYSRQNEFNIVLAYLQAQRLASQRNYAAAIELLRKADSTIGYGGVSDGLLKLVIRFLLANTLIESGDTVRGEAMLREIDQVNPHFNARFKNSLLVR